MQTVNFQCGHCGNLMAVSVEFLGQQVRCPHCQQVVIAPATAVAPAPAAAPAPSPAPAPAPAPVFDPLLEKPFRSLAESEDIFHERTEPEDALFGQEEPRLELPREPVPLPPMPPDPVPAPAPVPAPLEPSPLSGEATLPYLPPGEPAPAETSTQAAPLENGAAGLPWSQPAPPADAATATVEQPPFGPQPLASPRKPRDTSGRINWFIPLVFIPLVLYAVMATAAAGFLYIRLRTVPPSLFDRIPDVDGDTPGVRKRTEGIIKFDPATARMPLPEHLHVELGETVRVGDLEVTPIKVERRKVAMFAEDAEEQAEPSPNDALVLRLRLKNVAKDYAFTPLDNYFDRRWKPGNDKSCPLTLLRAGKETFFGGPAKWFPLKRAGDRGERREWLEGRQNVDREGLGPGKETETYVATDGWDPAVSQYLFGVDGEGRTVRKPYQGKLLWRVQLRRGLVPWKGQERSATAVIGVEFTDKAYAGGAG